MAAPSAVKPPDIDYPSSDGSPMAETDDHRENMVDLIETLKAHFARAEPPVYVSGNLFVFYEPGNRLRHLAPDVFVVRGVPNHRRDNYLIWEEGKGPEVVVELTSRSTKGEDVDDKFWLYRDVLKVSEYFLFDPHQEYLNPPLQGYRLTAANTYRLMVSLAACRARFWGCTWNRTRAACGCSIRLPGTASRLRRRLWCWLRLPGTRPKQVGAKPRRRRENPMPPAGRPKPN